MNKPGLALNNPQWLICHKSKPNQTLLLPAVEELTKIFCLGNTTCQREGKTLTSKPWSGS